MDETTKRALLKTTDQAIRQAKVELEKLQSYRAWILEVGTPTSAPPLPPPDDRRDDPIAEADEEQRTTADYIESAFVNIGPTATLTIPEIVRASYDVGWTTTSDQPETVIRTTVGRMGQDGRLEALPLSNGEPRRFRLKTSR